MVTISRELLLTTLHLSVHGLLSVVIALVYKPEEGIPAAAPLILFTLLTAMSLELLLQFIPQGGRATKLATNAVRFLCLLLMTVFCGRPDHRKEMRISSQFRGAEALRPPMLYVALRILHAENLSVLGFTGTIIYGFGLHVSLYGTSMPKLVQLFSIGRMAAEALGLAIIQRSSQRDNLSIHRLAGMWIFQATPISLVVMYVFGYLSNDFTPFETSAYISMLCLRNIAIMVISVCCSWSFIRNYGVVALLYVEEMMERVMAIALKYQPQPTITGTLSGCLTASCGFVMYGWTRRPVNGNDAGGLPSL